jgi:hypothetical protein
MHEHECTWKNPSLDFSSLTETLGLLQYPFLFVISQHLFHISYLFHLYSTCLSQFLNFLKIVQKP